MLFGRYKEGDGSKRRWWERVFAASGVGIAGISGAAHAVPAPPLVVTVAPTETSGADDAAPATGVSHTMEETAQVAEDISALGDATEDVADQAAQMFEIKAEVEEARPSPEPPVVETPPPPRAPLPPA
jgi:hypothetical protein